MKALRMFLSSVVFSVSLFASAGTPAQTETYFFKISKSLRGIPPTMEEREAFAQAVQAGTTEAFLAQKTQEYFADNKFTFKLKQKVDELLKLRQQTEFDKAPNQTGTAYDLLVSDIIQKNSSWDQLLLAKSYRYMTLPPGDFPSFSYDQDAFFMIPSQGDTSYPSFEEYFSPEKTPKVIEHSVTFTPDDQRVAGIVTTPRFFGRYVNTALNKNRRRAAAVFRVFLCDSMAPSVPAADNQGEKQDFDTIFPGHSSYAEEDIRRNTLADVHGQLMDCKACHYKLDPLGQVFGFSAATLSPMAAPGALAFKGQDGRDVSIPLRGLGDMAQALTQQPEYLKCQVRHFWRWYIGKDVPVSRHKEQELVRKFEDLGRKPHDFISYLVSLPEFKERPLALTEDQLLARRAVSIMKNCNDCHQSQDKDPDMRNWDLTDLPYSQDPDERKDAIRLLRKNLDIDHDGAGKKMPPKDSLWKLSQDDFNILRDWLNHGAPDFEGKPQVPPKGTP